MKPVDAVVIGLGWTGSIMSMELTSSGLNVVALEFGTGLLPSPLYETVQSAS